MLFTPPKNQPWHTVGARPYVMAVGLSLLFLGLRLALEPVMHGQAPLIALLAAPLLACWYCGFGPGLLATVLCAVLGELLLVAPQYLDGTPDAAEWLRLTIFILYGVLFSWLIETRRRIVRDLLAEREELLQTQKQLAEREAMFHSLADNIAPLAWRADASGAIDWYNRRWFYYTGTTLAEMKGWGWRHVHHPDHLARVEEKFRRHVHSGEPWEDTFPLRSRDGDYRWFLSQAFPLHDDAGRVVSWFGTNTDIDAQRQAESALLEADRRKDEFIAVLAHELRNPLAPVRNAVEILKRVGPPEPRLERTRAIIERQVTHMARLLDDLLDVSRITRGKLELKVQRCDLAAIVQDTAEDYRTSIEAAGLQLVLHTCPTPLWVQGDPVRLAQMLGNVLANAERFNQPDGRIEVRCRLDESGTSAVVQVQDTGVGIDAALLSRLFEPFAQGVQDLARSKGGLGLGMAVTQGLVALHGGTITADSAGPGQGASFTLRLPLAAARHEPGPAPDLANGHMPQRRRVLVVEDNHDAAATLGELLQLMGHQVELAYDGTTALATARQWQPEVVISDLGLPGELDGYRLAAAVRADPLLAGTRLVALSGYADQAARHRCTEAGFDAHLAKPPDLGALERVLAARTNPAVRSQKTNVLAGKQDATESDGRNGAHGGHDC